MATPLAVLIVEDSDSDAQLIVRLLKKAGYEITFQVVETAAHMRAALAQATWDIVISDYSLPQFDGPAALRLLQETGQDIPFITVSGTMGEETAVAMMKTGVHDYLMKGNLTRLAPAVDRELRDADTRRKRKRAEDALRESEAKLKKAQHYAHLGSWTWNIQTNQLDWSDEMFRIFGLDRETFTGSLETVMAQAIHPDDRLKVEQSNLSVIQHKQPIPLEYRVVWPDQSVHVVWAEAGELLLDEAGQPTFLSGTAQDITERKRAEEALRRRDQEFSVLVENAPDMIVRFDTNLRHIYCNPAVERQLGISAEVFLGKAPLELATPRRQDEFVDRSLRQVLETGAALEVEQSYITPLGLRHFQTRIVPERDPNGRIESLLAITRDITARKQTEEELKQSEARLAAAQAVAKVGSWETDLLNLKVIWSEETYRIFEVDPNRFHPSHPGFLTLVHPADRAQVDAAFAGSFDTHTLNAIEHRIVTPGGVKTVEERWWIFHDGQGRPWRSVGTCQDITERKRAEEEIRKLNTELEERVIERTAELSRLRERERAILDAMGEGVVFTDRAGTIEYINPAMERLTGFTAQESVGQNPRLWQSGQTPRAVYQQMWDTLTRGEMWQGELVNRHRAGRLYEAALIAATLTTPDGQIIGFVGVQRDITRQKELDRLKDQFVSNVSHELRTPLANLKLYLALLDRGRPEKRADYMQTLHREQGRLDKLIEDLLDISRLDRQVTPVELTPLDLHEFLGPLVADRVTAASERGLRLEFLPTAESPLVLAEASMLTQVVSNLLTNALNYTPAGGRVTVQTHRQRTAAQDWLTLIVRDTGPGIAAHELPHVFERFYRGQVGRKAKAPGTGLGLAISKEIVEKLGGRITVESEPGPEERGATFTVWLRPQP